MATSADYFRQLESYGVPGDPNVPTMIEQGIKKAYEGPVGQLINEGLPLRQSYYGGLFQNAQNYGTGAGDMSPSARLAAMIGDTETSGSRYRANLGLRDYYNTTVGNLVDRAMQGYQMGYNTLKDLYMTALQREELERARRGGGGGRRYAGGYNIPNLATLRNTLLASDSQLNRQPIDVGYGLPGQTAPITGGLGTKAVNVISGLLRR